MIDPASPHPERADLFPLSNRALVARFSTGVEAFDRRVLELTDGQLDTAFFPEAGVGRWPCRVLLGHLADAEVAFVHRFRRVAGEDNPILSAWDEEAFIDAGLYGKPNQLPRPPIGAFIAAIHSLRQWMTVWLGSSDDALFNRKGLHEQRGEQTLRVILEYDTWHIEHHAWFLNKKVAKLMG